MVIKDIAGNASMPEQVKGPNPWRKMMMMMKMKGCSLPEFSISSFLPLHFFVFEILPLQTTRKENNWKTEEALARAVVTLQSERIKESNP